MAVLGNTLWRRFPRLRKIRAWVDAAPLQSAYEDACSTVLDFGHRGPPHFWQIQCSHTFSTGLLGVKANRCGTSRMSTLQCRCPPHGQCQCPLSPAGVNVHYGVLSTVANLFAVTWSSLMAASLSFFPSADRDRGRRDRVMVNDAFLSFP